MSVISQAIGGGSSKRKVDDRVKCLIDDAAENQHRSIVMVVGDRAKDQVVNLHTLVSRANHSSRVNVLWCMKSDVDFGSTSKRRLEKTGRLEVKAGMASEQSKENFQTWLSHNEIRFCHYKETHKVLGNTFGMAVLQDFEALTPNILARTIETVKGGGIIVIMLRHMSSLQQLYTMTMDVHSRYRTESLQNVVPRFNERFILSLAECDNVLCVDDALNVLPFTTKMQELAQAKSAKKADRDQQLRVEGKLRHEAELKSLKDKLKGVEIGPLVQLCRTMDQAKVALSLLQVVAEKTLSTTCVVTAARGRGKSASLGLAVAGAITNGYSNILVTSPSPENLQTFFEFVVSGLLELGYSDKVDFQAMQSTNPEYSKCIIRVDVFKNHRQTIQYVSATDSAKFAQAELLVIDEAAALPLPLVQKMIGPYLIFISSTVAGYEGTGRSLSMKLVEDMKKHSGSADGRSLKELKLHDPIRYGPSDPVEAWLNQLLCLDATDMVVPLRQIPHPSKCRLYYVNRDALFSFHKKAESLLQKLVALLVSAHYKNQPNDLQLMSDAPGHHIFVLCAPIQSSQDLPDILCVIHACEEGNVSANNLNDNLSKGLRPAGDLIPYTLAQQFMEDGFAKLKGLRVVRIATNSELQRSGYGSRALELLLEYFRGNINVTAAEEDESVVDESRGSGADALTAKPRSQIPTLMTPIEERPYEPFDYVGTSYGITTPLFNFWSKAKFAPLYVRQQANDLTGEHSCVMVCPLGYDVALLKREFHRRFLSLLAYSFRGMTTELALSVVADLPVHIPAALSEATRTNTDGRCVVDGVVQASFEDIMQILPLADLQRLKLFSTTYVDMGVVLDLVPTVAKLYFGKKIFKCPDGTDGVVLPHAQAAVLLGIGLQCSSFDQLSRLPVFAGVQVQQLRAFFSKALNRIMEHITKLQKAQQEAAMDDAKEDQTIRYDSEGNVVGMSIATKVTNQVQRDQTLFRDANSAGVDTTTGATTDRQKKQPKKGGPPKQKRRM